MGNRNFSFVIPDKLAGMGEVELEENHLEELKKKNIYGIVTCTENRQDSDLIESCGMEYLFVPMIDFTPPSVEQIEEFVNFTENLNDEGKGVVVHCAAGIGRTGTMLASYMVYQNMGKTEVVIKNLREMRKGSVETKEQEEIIEKMEEYWRDSEDNL